MIFKTGLELAPGVDYRLDHRQILMIGPNIPQPGELLTAVYSPASQEEIKETDRSFASGQLGATPSGEFSDLALRVALELESRTAITSISSPEGAEASRSLRMLEERQYEGRAPSTSKRVNSDPNALGDRLSSPSVQRVAQEPPLTRVRLQDGEESKALEMLKQRIARDSPDTLSSREVRTPSDR
jgi:hypothetical protein